MNLAGLTFGRSDPVVRCNILVRSVSTVLASAPTRWLLIAASVAAGCSVYSGDLLDPSPGADAGAAGEQRDRAGASGDGLGDAGAFASGEAGATSSDGGSAAGGSPSGGRSGASGGTAGGGTGSAGGPTIDPNLIDDFEDGDSAIHVIAAPRRDGLWDVNNDGTEGGVQTPLPQAFLPTLLGSDVPYAGDQYAGYTKGSGFKTFGAYMNVTMRVSNVYADTPQYDASAYTGIKFWAKVGSGATIAKSMRVRFISGDSDPRGKKCKDPAAMPAPLPDEYCYNHYYQAVALTSAWKQYTLPFNAFVQGGAGMTNPTIDLAEMYGLEFYFLQNSDFELWLDDLSFTK